MADLEASQFREFFQALHKKTPFPWQEALAAQVCAGDWPDVIDLPTASGKSACIDIALFALAVRRQAAPRRIFFVVDRRLVVNEAYLRMRKVQSELKNALTKDGGGALREVAERLRQLARGRLTLDTDLDDSDPLFVYEMRGGAFRDETWVRNPLQPTVVVSTVDQVGSRLLFRGYGVSENSWPLHAGLIGNDALIILDEAHCSRAFAQTLRRLKKYRGAEWAPRSLRKPFHFVEMTATPSQQGRVKFVLTDNDRKTDVLQRRLQAAKPTRLFKVNGRKDDTTKLVNALVEKAIDLAKVADVKRVAIFVNRVKTAKQTYKQLRQVMEGSAAQVELVIGSMRAVDRDDLYERKLQWLKSDVKRSANAPLTFVVSTQCLEVGADLDFDVLVSECASIDALQQRFGRLDRLGEFGHARGAVVIGSWQINPKQPDAVYGEALSKTWEWLARIASESEEVNLGIESRAGEQRTANEQLDQNKMRDLQSFREGEDAPVLLPAHVDMLVQTNPVPKPSPLVELFLHGPKRGVPDVQVVWRSDLEDVRDTDEEIEIIKLCPPSSRETMAVSISAFKKWFAGEKDIDDKESDLEIGVDEGEVTPHQKKLNHVLAWDGEKSERIWDVNKIKPGQTLILKTSADDGRKELGYVPEGAPADVADRAAFALRSSVSLRLHPKLMKEWHETPALKLLIERIDKADLELKEAESLLREYKVELEQGPKLWPYEFLGKLNELRQKELDAYPEHDHPYVLTARIARKSGKQEKNEPVFLEEHLADVENAVAAMADGLDVHLQEALRKSARLHDYGKIDLRFQAWLRGGDLMAARYSPKPIAKSGKYTLPKQKTVGLPEGFRHELLSLMFAGKSQEVSGEMRDLILHLVAAHHGRCRPFAPVVLDEDAECVSYGGVLICEGERRESAPHGLDSGVPDRFWQLTAKYGWWGLAYLEAILRLADWHASRKKAAEVEDE